MGQAIKTYSSWLIRPRPLTLCKELISMEEGTKFYMTSLSYTIKMTNSHVHSLLKHMLSFGFIEYYQPTADDISMGNLHRRWFLLTDKGRKCIREIIAVDDKLLKQSKRRRKKKK